MKHNYYLNNNRKPRMLSFEVDDFKIDERNDSVRFFLSKLLPVEATIPSDVIYSINGNLHHIEYTSEWDCIFKWKIPIDKFIVYRRTIVRSLTIENISKFTEGLVTGNRVTGIFHIDVDSRRLVTLYP